MSNINPYSRNQPVKEEIEVCLAPTPGRFYKMAKRFTNIGSHGQLYTTELLYYVGRFEEYVLESTDFVWAIFEKDGHPVKFRYKLGETCFQQVLPKE